MKTITATEAQNNFGDLLMTAQSEPISITRNGKSKGVLLSADDFEKVKEYVLQAAITAGFESGDAGILDMQEIKREARKRAGLDAES